jgi:hypothetical protein
MVAPAKGQLRWANGTRGSAMALVQSQQSTGSGMSGTLMPLLFLGVVIRWADVAGSILLDGSDALFRG